MALRSRYRVRLLIAGLAALSVAATATAVAGGSARKETRVNVVERDFAIRAPHTVTAGDVTFAVHNRGPDDHEFIVIRAPRGGLPFRRDGMTVDEDALEHWTTGGLEPGVPGSVHRLHVHLTPGRYVLICNMAGHYLGGMHAVLTVR